MPGLEAAKAYAALLVTMCGVATTTLTALLAPDTATTHWVLGILIVVSALASALATYQTPNEPKDNAMPRQGGKHVR